MADQVLKGVAQGVRVRVLHGPELEHHEGTRRLGDAKVGLPARRAHGLGPGVGGGEVGADEQVVHAVRLGVDDGELDLSGSEDGGGELEVSVEKASGQIRRFLQVALLGGLLGRFLPDGRVVNTAVIVAELTAAERGGRELGEGMVGKRRQLPGRGQIGHAYRPLVFVPKVCGQRHENRDEQDGHEQQVLGGRFHGWRRLSH